MPATAAKPEAAARVQIDAMLTAAGWLVQDYATRNLHGGQGVAVREFPLTTGFADYLLFIDQKAVGALEAKPVGFTLTGVEPQAGKYAHGLPLDLHAPQRPLPFLYLSTGAKTRFVNLLDPSPFKVTFSARLSAVAPWRHVFLWQTAFSWVRASLARACAVRISVGWRATQSLPTSLQELSTSCLGMAARHHGQSQ